MPYDADAKKLARAFLNDVRARTVCSNCGAQPVEFHNEEHEKYPNRRVAHLAALGFPLARIQHEIEVSKALCRRCHMKEDGRSAALSAARPFQRGTSLPPKPCTECKTPAKPLRRGLCNKCNHRKRAKTK